MPLTIPAFVQYQQPIIPVRGLWNATPREGDKSVNLEIAWGTYAQACVQFSLSGNSPVALSQIVSIYTDNSRCGSDVDLIFPDTEFSITIPARNQILCPVITNALMFYVKAVTPLPANAADMTILQVCNSMPPPIPLLPASAQNSANVTGVNLVNGSTSIVPAGVNGTLNSISVSGFTTGTGSATIILQDGTGKQLWADFIEAPQTIQENLSGLSTRFVNGIALVVSGSTLTGGAVAVNLYYSTP